MHLCYPVHFTVFKMSSLPPLVSNNDVIERMKNTRVNRILNVVMKAKEVHARQTIQLKTNLNKMNILKDKASYRTDRELDLAHFKSLLSIFKVRCLQSLILQAASSSGSGSLDFEEFRDAFSSVLGSGLTEDQMLILFNKIDANTDNLIDWDDFSEFMLLRAEGQKIMKEEAETQLFSEDAGSRSEPIQTPHRDMICKLHYSPQSKRFLTVSKDGTVCYWSEHLRLLRSFKNVGYAFFKLTHRQIQV